MLSKPGSVIYETQNENLILQLLPQVPFLMKKFEENEKILNAFPHEDITKIYIQTKPKFLSLIHYLLFLKKYLKIQVFPKIPKPLDPFFNNLYIAQILRKSHVERLKVLYEALPLHNQIISILSESLDNLRDKKHLIDYGIDSVLKFDENFEIQILTDFDKEIGVIPLLQFLYQRLENHFKFSNSTRGVRITREKREISLVWIEPKTERIYSFVVELFVKKGEQIPRIEIRSRGFNILIQVNLNLFVSIPKVSFGYSEDSHPCQILTDCLLYWAGQKKEVLIKEEKCNTPTYFQILVGDFLQNSCKSQAQNESDAFDVEMRELIKKFIKYLSTKDVCTSLLSISESKKL